MTSDSTSAIVAVAVLVCAVVCIGYANASSCSRSNELCGSTGWKKLGIADFRDHETPCPEGTIVYGGFSIFPRGCGRHSQSPSAVTINIPTSGTSYSQVCGKVFGYPWRTLDGFKGSSDIEGNYVDGISVTYGPAGSRQHIFSLASVSGNGIGCPCADNSTHPNSQPHFVGDDYYCESGGSGDILWDGEQCDGVEAPCCTSPYIPYFYKYLDVSTTDDIELRIMISIDEIGYEDIYLLAYEFYIK